MVAGSPGNRYSFVAASLATRMRPLWMRSYTQPTLTPSLPATWETVRLPAMLRGCDWLDDLSSLSRWRTLLTVLVRTWEL